MRILNLRVLRTKKNVHIPDMPEMIGGSSHLEKRIISDQLQWQTVEKIEGEFLESDWHDVPTVIYDADEDQYV